MKLFLPKTLILLLFPLVAFSQHIHNGSCITKNYSEEEQTVLEQQMRIYIEALQKNKNFRTANTGTTCIPIKVHDVLNSSGTGAVDMTLLNRDLANLNYHFKNANLEFYFCGPISTVVGGVHYDFIDTNENDLITLEPMANNAFNLYLVNSINGLSSGISGYAYLPGNFLKSTFCVMRKDDLAYDDNGTLVHEYGHHFNLQHTFASTENGPTNANAENVPRTGPNANCSTKGDFVCDTDADPKASSTQISNCIYTGNATDINGVMYTPPIDNIMSYYDASCGGRFTPGQYTRIIAAAALRATHGAYSLNCSPASVSVASNLTAAYNGNAVQLSWTDNANNEMGYLIERSSTSASSGFSPLPMGGVSANSTSFSDNNVSSVTTYWYRVKASNGNCNSYSNVAEISTGIQYCFPAYNNSCTNAVISNVTFTGLTTINNSSSCVGQSYADYSTTDVSKVAAGSTYPISVTLSSSGFLRYIQIFVDYNADGDFDDANEKALPDNTNCPSVYNGNITIPASATNGSTRMRIILRNQASPLTDACETNMSFGETEDYALTITGGTNPVAYTAFTALQINNTIQLNWTTASEANNKFFVIQRSSDGINFTSIDTIAAAGLSTSQRVYQAIDNSPLTGSNTYRLLQLSFANDSSYSVIVTLNFIPGLQTMVLSPNPVQKSLYVSIMKEFEGTISYRVLDLTGKVLIEKNNEQVSNGLATELDASYLQPGVYLLSAAWNGRVEVLKFLKE